MKLIAKSSEYSKDNFEIIKENNITWTEEELSKLTDKPNKKYLGLYKEFDYTQNKFFVRPHYYIGYRWIDEQMEEYICISPKESNGKQADYLKMFLTCLKDPIVSKKMDDCYDIKFNEKWIDTEGNKDEMTPFLILHFLSVVKKISQKGLKKGYVKVTENLTSKIKGKILVNQTIKHNHFKNRLDKTVCNHQIFTIDCLENKILKTAMMQSSKYLHGIDNRDEISKLLNYNLSSFELVNSKDINNSDFTKIKHSPFYKEYKEALRLAQMIFKRFGFTLNSSHSSNNYKIPPFYIDMPELFERYVEVKLREKYKDSLLPGYSQKNGNSYTWGLRPDFIVKNEKLIIDAKYKYWFENQKDNRFKDDFQQLALYGREQRIREIIGLKDSNEDAKILFIYPNIDGKKSINHDFNLKSDSEIEGDFNEIYTLGISIPPAKDTK